MKASKNHSSSDENKVLTENADAKKEEKPVKKPVIPNPFKKKRHITDEEDIYRDRYVEVPKKQKKKMGIIGKSVLCLLGVALLILLIWLAYILIRFYFYDEYKDFVQSYTYEEGTEFVALSDASPSVEGMVLVAENEYLKLYTNTETAEIAVYDKRSGVTTYSNPVNLEEDEIANETNKNYLRSQFILEYFNSGRTTGIFDSYSASVEKGQVTCCAIENGIRYTYKVGEAGNSTGIVPKYIDPDRFEEILAQLPAEEAETLAGYFQESETVAGFLEMKSSVSRSTAILEKMNDMFERAGFTSEEFVEQLTNAGMENLLSPNFTIELEYRLNGDGLDVSVPMCSVVEGGGAKIYRLQVLKFFGAADVNQEGYMVVPNGSGSIIYFNNGKTNKADYSQYIYGMDPLSQDYTVLENSQPARLPLFGISSEESDILVTVEDGASLSFITASISGKVNSYNYVYNTFVLRGFDTLSMFGSTGNEADLPVVEKNYYDVNLSLRYSFLDEEHEGYAGMANYYRERLEAEGVLTLRKEEGDIPFYYDVIGGVKRTSNVLGIQYLSVYPMTTFEEAEGISNDLAQRGIENQVMNFQGWFNGGYYHDVANRVYPIWKLGGRSGLESLNDTVEANGGDFYADVAFQEVSFISRRYQYSFETSRYYGAGYVAYFGQVNPSSLRQTSSLGYQENMYNILSPRFLPRYVGYFANKMQGYNVEGISLRDLGDTLASDRRRTAVINREEALDVVISQFEVLEGTGKNIMVDGGNGYSLAYADDIINAPIQDNNYYIIDQDIPFYEMVIHGYIDYCGTQLNADSTADYQKDILSLIEYGAAPHYIFTHENATEMKYTALNRYYSTTYDNWKEEAEVTYNQVNEALSQVSGALMIGHEEPADGVRKVTYDNGVIIYVNYNNSDVTVDGITVPAKDYEIGGVAE